MHDLLTPSAECRLPKPPPIFPYRPCSLNGKTSPTIRNGRAVHMQQRSSIAWLRSLRTLARVIVAIAPFMCQIAGSTFSEVDRARTEDGAF